MGTIDSMSKLSKVEKGGLLKDEDEVFKDYQKAQNVYRLIVGYNSEPLNNFNETIQSKTSLKEKVEIVDDMLDRITGIKSNWNRVIKPVSADTQQQFEGIVLGAYNPDTHEMELRNDASLATIIHELMHARANSISDSEWEKLTETEKLIEKNIEDSLCELVAYEIYKSLNKELYNDVAYVDQTSTMFQMYKIITKGNTSIIDFTKLMYRYKRGERYKEVIRMIKDTDLNYVQERNNLILLYEVFSNRKEEKT